MPVQSRRGPDAPHNLPSRLTSFIGREREIREIMALVLCERLVALVGAPGVGKTRLSLQIAAGVIDQFPDGVWLVELAPLADPGLVPQAVATVLGVHEQPGHPLTATLAGYLRTRRLLLLLDNCEHLIQAAAALAETLLQTCPGLHVLATSREPLAIEGEQTCRVPSLTLSSATGIDVRNSEAVRLFVERARAVSPTFALTERNEAPVGQICTRLDGVPLAIELAAARVRALSVEQIAARLDDRFRLLTGGSRTALPRQQTLRGAVDWSYDLLSAPEQVLLRHLAVFAGGFSLEAAEYVGSSDTLVSLVDKSLVQIEEVRDGEPRYRMLETFRQYGREKLTEHGELTAARDRHRDYVLAFAEGLASHLRERTDGVVLDRIELEHDNLRVALDWCLDGPSAGQRDPVAADHTHSSLGGALSVRLAAAIWRYWWLRGHIGEGRRWLARALAVPTRDTSPAGLAARDLALLGIANLSAYQGDYRSAVTYMTEKLAFSRETGNDHGLVFALQYLGNCLAHVGEAERGTQLCAEAVVLGRQLGDPVALAWALDSSALAARMSGRPEQSVILSDEAISLFRARGNVAGMAYATSSKSYASAELGDSAKGLALTEDCLRLFQEVGDKRGAALSFKDIARFATFAGDADRVIEPLRTALTMFLQLRDRFQGTICLEILAGVSMLWAAPALASDVACAAQTDGADEPLLDAVRLYAWADLVRAESGLDPPPEMRGAPERNIALLRKHLDEAAFTQAWAEGGAMSFDEAVEYALALTAPAAPEPRTRTASVGARAIEPDAMYLTAREREVAALIVQGRTNREIAEALVLSERTVDSHVRNVMGKLEVNSRAQVAAWAVQHGIGASR